MKLQPWYKVVTPREDLRKERPLDASEFAVHLDQIRDGRAPEDYQNPARFFERTYLTQNLTILAAEVLRRFAGEKVGTSAVFNLATQFGGGKTHALTMLYHLGRHGSTANRWHDVSTILARAELNSVPQMATAVFVGTEFDSLTGRGGKDGTPLRKTPWGEIAFQLGGEAAFAVVAEHDERFIEPKGDVIRAFLPKDRPCLILLDEIINYASTYRRLGYHNSLYNFIQALSETARGEDNVVLVVSIPASELEYTAADETDEQRFKKMLDRLGKAIMMSVETETSEIIRRRLFEWSGLPREAERVINAYAEWVVNHRQDLPNLFPIDHAWDAFAATYPFHPMVISVFERKWRVLPRFQQTRGILRLLALWVARAFNAGYQGAHEDPLIDLGTAPLDDPLFRAATFEQLGETRLEGVVTTDICGKPDAHAIRLDESEETIATIKKARLHRKVATTIFFESNGGSQARTEATLAEVRLAVGEPTLDLGNVKTVLDTIASTFFYLEVKGEHYRFSTRPNLNKLHTDRRASIQPEKIEERIQQVVETAFQDKRSGLEIVFSPEKSNAIPDLAVLTLAVLAPDLTIQDSDTLKLVEKMTREAGASARTYKSAILWAIADDIAPLREEARRTLAWEEISSEQHQLKLDPDQLQQLSDNLRRAQRDLTETVWRTYRKLALLSKNNDLRVIDLGLVHSSAATSLTELIVRHLRQAGEIEDAISPNFLVRNWPPAFKEWSTKAVQDIFFASPQFPRLLKSNAIKETIAKGVSNGILACVSKDASGNYISFHYNEVIEANSGDIEISSDVFIISKEAAEAYLKAKNAAPAATEPQVLIKENGESFVVGAAVSATEQASPHAPTSPLTNLDVSPNRAAGKLSWTGRIPPQKWMNFYTKVLSRFANTGRLNISISVEVAPDGGISEQKVEETKVALRELGLDDQIKIE